MKALLHHWIKSFYFFSPRSLKNTLLQSTWSFCSAMMHLIKNFYPILLGELILFGLLTHFFAQQKSGTEVISGVTIGIMISSFALGILSLVSNSALFLFIRKAEDDTTPAIPYFKYYFFRYLQFSLLAFAIALFSLSLLLGLGIKKMPGIATVLLGLKVIEFLALFFWLDSSFSLKEMFFSVEKAINMFVYNLPLFATLSFIWWTAEKTLLFAFFGTPDTEALTTTSLSQRVEIANMMQQGLSATTLVAVKYSRLLIEFFWICIVFRAYKERCQTEYATSLFEPNQDQDDE